MKKNQLPIAVSRFESALARLEGLINKPIAGTPAIGGRVRYVALPGTKKNRAALTIRARQVLAAIKRHRLATSAVLQNALDVNRNVIAGAVHELKRLGFVRSEGVSSEGPRGFAGLRTADSSASYQPRRSRRRKAR